MISPIQHEEYMIGVGRDANDLAVLYLDNFVDLEQDNTDVIRIARAADGDFNGQQCQMCGWGFTESKS